MKNIGQMMKQAQAMQGKMAEMQEKLDVVEVEGQAAGGLLAVFLNGKGECKRVKIDPSLVNPDDAEVLEDLIVAAHKDAKGKLETRLRDEMEKVTGGLGLPSDFKLPF